jgi:prepilin-type N-terminal cleavage/methylation domain-containing protein
MSNGDIFATQNEMQVPTMMHQTNNRRRGVSLLELLVVVTLMGIFGAVVIGRYGRKMLTEFGSQSDARRVSLDLLTVQRAAILTGDNHYLEFTSASGKVVGYQMFRRWDNGNKTKEAEYRELSEDIVTKSSHAQAEFNFEGQSLGAYSITMTGKNREISNRCRPHQRYREGLRYVEVIDSSFAQRQ